MHHGYIIGVGNNNDIFNEESVNNRDNCFLPFIYLRSILEESNIHLDTYDLCNRVPDFIILMNACIDSSKFKCPVFMLLMESEFIFPQNGFFNKKIDFENNYYRVFSWDERYIKYKNYIKINYGNPIAEQCATYPSLWLRDIKKNKLCCIIAGNKSVAQEPKAPFSDLYKERLKVIRWFEENHLSEFSLYGHGWDYPAPKVGNKFYNKYIRRLFFIYSKITKRQFFPSYISPVKSKIETLERYRFSFCFENIYGQHGYVTEKIFDAMMAGCVPIYYGAPDINKYVPEKAFINYAEFECIENLYEFISAMSEADYKSYLNEARKFLLDDSSYPFTAQCFALTIAKEIISISITGVSTSENK